MSTNSDKQLALEAAQAAATALEDKVRATSNEFDVLQSSHRKIMEDLSERLVAAWSLVGEKQKALNNDPCTLSKNPEPGEKLHVSINQLGIAPNAIHWRDVSLEQRKLLASKEKEIQAISAPEKDELLVIKAEDARPGDVYQGSTIVKVTPSTLVVHFELEDIVKKTRLPKIRKIKVIRPREN